MTEMVYLTYKHYVGDETNHYVLLPGPVRAFRTMAEAQTYKDFVLKTEEYVDDVRIVQYRVSEWVEIE